MKDVDVDRLTQAIHRSRRVLQFWREDRRETVRQFVGRHWSSDGAKKSVPVNLLALYTSVLSVNLIAKNPRFLLSTFQKPNKWAVAAMQSWANKRVEDMGLFDTLQRIVTDALFSIGICKVALATPSDSYCAGWNLQAGSAFAAPVDLDDWVYDTHAKRFSHASFLGHRFRAPLEVIRDDPSYSKARKKLTPTPDRPYNREGDERIDQVGRGVHGGDHEEFGDYVDLWEVYLPWHRLVLTLSDDQVSGGPSDGVGDLDSALRVQKWIGPPEGPYHILSYGVVPGNAMPKAPLQDLVDLHELINHVFRKLGRQAMRQKEVTLISRGKTEDGRRIVEASDGEMLGVDDPKAAQVMSFGNLNPLNFQFFEACKQLFGYMAKNMDMLGGLSPQSKTLGQDRMLEENSSRAVADMQTRTAQFTSDVGKALCWYWWNDPFQVMQAEYALPGLPEHQITRTVTPGQRIMVPWDQLKVKVDPYSMQYATPSSRLNALNGVMQQIILPLMPALMAQGQSADLIKYIEKVAEYADMPDLSEILTTTEPIAQGGGGMEMGGMPQETTRNYVRENMPGRTEKGDSMNRMNALAGVDPGGAPEMNGVMQ